MFGLAKNLNKKKGFTLIEIMIVIAIIGLLSVVIIPKALPLKNQAKNNAVQANVYIIRSFLENRAGADKINIVSLLKTKSDAETLTLINNGIHNITGVEDTEGISSDMNTTFSGSSAVKNPFSGSVAINSTHANIVSNDPQNSSIVIGYDTGNIPADVSDITSTINTPGVIAIIVYKTGYVAYGIGSSGELIEPTLVNMSNNVAVLPDFTNPTIPTVQTLTVNLGRATNYTILTKTGVTNVPTSQITGNIGVSPSTSTVITGFSLNADATNKFSTSTQVTGKVYAANYTSPTPSNLTLAISDMETAYNDAAGRIPNYTAQYAGDISGKTLTPGVYKWSTSVLINSDVTISGGADDVWIFQIAKGLTQASGAKINLTGGAQAKNIFWQVAEDVRIGANAHFEGIILAKTKISMNTNASVNGRLLSQNAVTLIQNILVAPTQSDALSLNIDRVYDFLAINAAEKIIKGGGSSDIYGQIQGNLYNEINGYFDGNPIINSVISGYNNIVFNNGYIPPKTEASVFVCQDPSLGNLDYSKYTGVIVVYPLVNNPIGYCIYGIDADGNKVGERELTLSVLMNSNTEKKLSDNVKLVGDYLQANISNQKTSCGNNIYSFVEGSLKSELISKYSGSNSLINPYVNNWKNVSYTTSSWFGSSTNSILLVREISSGFSSFKGTTIVNALIGANNTLAGYEVYGINYNGDTVGYRKIQ